MPQLGLFEIGYAELGQPPPSSATAYSQTLSASTESCSVDLTVPINVFSKGTGKSLVGSTTSPAASLVRNTFATLAAAMTTLSATVGKGSSYMLAAAMATLAALTVRSTGKRLQASASTLAGSTVRTTTRAIAASTSTLSAQVTRLAAKVISASASACSAVITKLTRRALSAASAAWSAVVSLQKLGNTVYQLSLVASMATFSVVRSWLTNKVLVSATWDELTSGWDSPSTSLMSAAVSRRPAKNLTASTSTPAASLVRSTARGLIAQMLPAAAVCGKFVHFSIHASLAVLSGLLNWALPGLTPAVRTIFVQFEQRVLAIAVQLRAWVDPTPEARVVAEPQQDRTVVTNGLE